MYVSRLPDINTQYVVYDYKWEVCLQTPNINKLNVMVGSQPNIVSQSWCIHLHIGHPKGLDQILSILLNSLE